LSAGQERAIREGLVRDLIALRRPAEAVAEARELRDLDKKNGTALKLLLKAHEAAGEWERAYETRAEVARATERERRRARALPLGHRRDLSREGKLDDAKRQFRRRSS
jgi:hypothetical protein